MNFAKKLRNRTILLKWKIDWKMNFAICIVVLGCKDNHIHNIWQWCQLILSLIIVVSEWYQYYLNLGKDYPLEKGYRTYKSDVIEMLKSKEDTNKYHKVFFPKVLVKILYTTPQYPEIMMTKFTCMVCAYVSEDPYISLQGHSRWCKPEMRYPAWQEQS